MQKGVCLFHPFIPYTRRKALIFEGLSLSGVKQRAPVGPLSCCR